MHQLAGPRCTIVDYAVARTPGVNNVRLSGSPRNSSVATSAHLEMRESLDD
ncbi:MAG: hypothetical protein KJP16_15150 [Gammaproteobacteria bacterium]|nr:hypothetical protein [Gammaproteobacteria bacterium]NNL52140.1 hypothetical protein [Woeseiaceae bacterium]